MSATFAVQLPKEQKAFLDKLALATKRSPDNVVSSVVGKMMENYNHALADLEEAEADVAAGRVYSMEDVEMSTQAILDKYKSA